MIAPTVTDVPDVLVIGAGAGGAVWIDRGVRHLGRARAVIVAANGVGTPRLLQLSGTGRFPDVSAPAVACSRAT
jgi:choline dehydrogenase-like flavoprotein